jgi:hypothetical protein
MKINKIQDERIISLKRKIQSDAYQILIFCLLLSIIIQQFLMNAPFSQFAAEFCVLIGIGLYTTVCHLLTGIDIWNSTKQSNLKILINSGTTGIISTGIYIILTGGKNTLMIVLFFCVVSVCYFIVHFLFSLLNTKRQKQMDEMFNNENE